MNLPGGFDMERGLLHTYYGEGKGKTTAAFGLAFRCAGRGKKVVIAQFLKGSVSGEILAAERFPNITLIRGKPTGKFTFQMDSEELAETARSCAGILREAISESEGGRMLVLDEVLDACALGLLDIESLLNFLEDRQDDLEVIMTGHSVPDAIKEHADYVTLMRKEKHPFDRGVRAREDVEF